MKNIQFYAAPQYAGDAYTEVEPMIYRTEYTNEPDDDSIALCGVVPELIPELRALTGWETDEFDEDLESLVYKGVKYYRQEFGANNELQYFILDPDEYGTHTVYATSIVFEQEPEYGENEPQDEEISQYPLEDILDEFQCMAGDDYAEENAKDTVHAYLELVSDEIENIRSVLGIIGRHVYNAEQNGTVRLVIE